MNPLQDPFTTGIGRAKLFLDARDIVREQFPDASDTATMSLIGQRVQAHCALLAADKIENGLNGLIPVSHAIENRGEA